MVAVGVGAGDGDQTGGADGGEDCLDMVGFVGAGIDHRHAIGIADDIGLGAGEGEGRRIGGEDAGDQRFEPVDLAGGPGLRGKVHGNHMGAVGGAVEMVWRLPPVRLIALPRGHSVGAGGRWRWAR